MPSACCGLQHLPVRLRSAVDIAVNAWLNFSSLPIVSFPFAGKIKRTQSVFEVYKVTLHVNIWSL
jgi:hypothetical protein